MKVIRHSEFIRLKKLAKIAKRKGNFEVCGIIGCNEKDEIRLFFLKNSSKAACNFLMKYRSVEILEKNLSQIGISIFGSFHSHPISEATPSRGDRENAFHNGHELIYDVIGNSLRLWAKNGSLVREVDCFSCILGKP